MQNNPGPNDPTYTPQPYPPYPGQPLYPPPGPPPRKRRIWLWILLGVFALAVLSCVGVLAASQGAQTGTQPQATGAPAGNTPTTKGTSTVSITHGTPRIGGPISDFYGKYGNPKNEGSSGSQTWIASQSPSIIVNASATNGKVNNMNVVGEPSWSRKYTETYCTRFLPGDARAFNRIKSSSDTLIDYHSSSGQIAMTVLDMGSCTLIIAGS